MAANFEQLKLFNAARYFDLARHVVGQCVVIELPTARQAIEHDPFIDDLQPLAEIIQFPKISADPPTAV